MTGDDRQSDEDDAVLVAALAAGHTQVDAGRIAGVSERTVRRRLESPAFRDLVRDARGEHARLVAARLAAAAIDAAATIASLLDPAHPAAIRIRAATALLDQARRWAEAVDLDDRLTELETLLGLRSEEDFGGAVTTARFAPGHIR